MSLSLLIARFSRPMAVVFTVDYSYLQLVRSVQLGCYPSYVIISSLITTIRYLSRYSDTVITTAYDIDRILISCQLVQ